MVRVKISYLPDKCQYYWLVSQNAFYKTGILFQNKKGQSMVHLEGVTCGGVSVCVFYKLFSAAASIKKYSIFMLPIGC